MKLSTEIALPVITYLWVCGLSLLSGMATYCNRICKGETLGSPYSSFFLDIFYCQMAGLITYFLAVSAGTEGFLTAALVSTGSHMGARLIFAVESLVMHTVHLHEQTREKD